MGKFVAQILGSADVQWKQIFEQAGQRYRAPTLVMFSGATRADACGQAQSAMGPFYCPPDNKIYLDTSFFREIERRFNGCDAGSSSCKFAQAYVIAHEVGHHVQNQLGILPKVQQQQRGLSKTEANRLQVKVELQADCFAGIWAARADKQWQLIQPGDVEAAMRTAAAIGDDRLQKQAQGYVVPDSFTHGSSEQRQRWFQTGLKIRHGRRLQHVRGRTRSSDLSRRTWIELASCPASTKRAIHPAQDRGADRLRHPLARRGQVRRDARRAHREGRSFGRGARDRHRRRREDPRAGEGLDRRSGDRRRDHHRRHRLHRPRRDAGSARAAVREAHGRLRDPVPAGEPRQDRHLGDPDARDRGRRGRDLHLLPARLARRLPRCLGRDPRAPARLPLSPLQLRRDHAAARRASAQGEIRRPIRELLSQPPARDRGVPSRQIIIGRAA